MDMNKKLGSKINELRELNKFSQEDVAKKIGFSRQRYSRLEKGELNIPYNILDQLSNIFNVKVVDITNVLEQERDVKAYFRNNNNTEEDKKAFESIFKYVEIFFAHKKMYNSTRRIDDQCIKTKVK